MDITQILLAVLGVLWFITCALSSLVWKNLEKEISKKVDREIYDVAQVSLIQDVRELKRGMDRMSVTLEEIRLALATAEGARAERERKHKEG